MNRPAEGMLAVFRQLWSPGRAYGVLLDPAGALWAAVASGLVVLAASAIPLLAVPLPQSAVLSMQNGQSLPVAALPVIALCERLVVAALGGTAAWAVARAAGRKTGLFLSLKASWLSQPAYVMAAVAAGLILDAAGAPPEVSPGPVALLGQPPENPSRLVAMAWLLLSMLDAPSLICLSCWGIGIASLERRPATSGMATTFSLYVLAVLLLALPVVSAP